jgi:multidrug efflux pump subunit AcrB
MMWLVQVALRRPLSVAVLALLMLVLGTLSFAYMNIDIFPAINLPVVMMVWNYPGLSPFDMERRMVTISERALSTTVNAIEHLESESIQGIGIVKIYFQPVRIWAPRWHRSVPCPRPSFIRCRGEPNRPRSSTTTPPTSQ